MSATLTVEQAQHELAMLEKELGQTIDSFHKRTGLPIEVNVSCVDVYAGYAIKERLYYRVEVTAQLQAANI